MLLDWLFYEKGTVLEFIEFIDRKGESFEGTKFNGLHLIHSISICTLGKLIPCYVHRMLDLQPHCFDNLTFYDLQSLFQNCTNMDFLTSDTFVYMENCGIFHNVSDKQLLEYGKETRNLETALRMRQHLDLNQLLFSE